VEGTIIDDPIATSDVFSLGSDEGLLPYSDDEDSDEEAEPTEPAGFRTIVWKPTGGSVTILPFDVVKALSDRTGSTFSVDHHRNEVRLHGGDLQDAVSRLNAIEAILASEGWTPAILYS
jgi:hypothetical protein